MIHSRGLESSVSTGRFAGRLGTVGYLAVFFWAMATMLLSPPERVPLVGAFCLVVVCVVYKPSLKRLVAPRRLLLMALMAVPPIFLMRDGSGLLTDIRPTTEGLLLGMQIAVRFVVIMAALEGLTAVVDISSIAGLFERLGLHGLGFSMGVALNLLPSLQESCENVWRSMWMRGGLRRNRWRGMRMLMVTIGTNALRRAEEIALAAEARAFSPENARPLPIKTGRWDRATVLVAVVLAAGILLV